MLNGHCNEVCPMKILLKEMIRLLREDQWARGSGHPAERFSLGIWGYFARKPKLYHRLTAMVGSAGHWLFKGKGYIESIPGISGWTRTRDLPSFKRIPFSKHLTNRLQ
jgi:L-lactate dehydrogenase complex protein LldF